VADLVGNLTLQRWVTSTDGDVGQGVAGREHVEFDSRQPVVILHGDAGLTRTNGVTEGVDKDYIPDYEAASRADLEGTINVVARDQ
jgi:hypothetical protein